MYDIFVKQIRDCDDLDALMLDVNVEKLSLSTNESIRALPRSRTNFYGSVVH